MIKSILDIINFLEKDAEDFSNYSDKEEFLIKQPGCLSERINVLENAVGLIPQTYRDFIARYDFNKVSVGYFSLSPVSYGTVDIVEALIEANLETPFLPKEFLNKNGLLWIGSNNDYTVYIANKFSHFNEGEIILIDEEILVDIDHPRDCDIQKLAKDFEQFLIVAGNLNQIHREINSDNSNWEEKKIEFIERLKKLGVSEEYHKAWLSVF